MVQPNSFIEITDFPTLKSDNSALINGTINGSVVVAGNGFLSSFSDLAIGVPGAVARGRISSSVNGSINYIGQNIQFLRTTGIVGGTGGATYSIFLFMYRVNPTTLRFQIYIPNPYSTALTCDPRTDSITWYVNTFLPPYA